MTNVNVIIIILFVFFLSLPFERPGAAHQGLRRRVALEDGVGVLEAAEGHLSS